MEETKPATQGDMTVVEVDLGDRSYPIYIGSSLLDRPELLQRLAFLLALKSSWISRCYGLGSQGE
jgi:hypothetical protein